MKPNDYVILATGRCQNSCVLCCMSGSPKFGIYHAGSTPQERQGLQNLILSMGETSICMTGGGDPLRNPEFIDIVNRYAKGEKNIVFNPLTFLSMQVGKPARRITNAEAREALTLSPEQINPSIYSLLDTLQEYSHLHMSSGLMQSPRPGLIRYSELFFKRLIQGMDGLNERLEIRRVNRRADIKFDYHLKDSPALRSHIRYNAPPESVVLSCFISLERNIGGTIYFKRDADNINLYFGHCSRVGMSQYNDFKTDITLDALAVSTPKQITSRMERQRAKICSRPYSQILCNDRYRPTKGPLAQHPVLDAYPSDRFSYLINLAEGMIRSRTKKRADIMKKSGTFGSELNACAVCSTMGGLLSEAGISPQEWQEYVDNEVIHSPPPTSMIRSAEKRNAVREFSANHGLEKSCTI
jgi:hypothetical protein